MKETSFNRLPDESGHSSESFIDQNISYTHIALNRNQTVQENKTGHKKNKSVTFQTQALNPVHKNHMSLGSNLLQIPQQKQQTSKDQEIRRESIMRRGYNAIKEKISSAMAKEQRKSHDMNYNAHADQSSSQLENSQLNESEELERVKQQLPENIIMLMMQPRREIDFSEENEPLDNEHKLRILIRQGSGNEGLNNGSLEDDRILQNAIAAKDDNLDQYFGNVIEAKAKQSEKIGNFIIENKSRGKMFWDILIMLYAMYNAFMIPIEVAYSGTFFSVKTKNALTYFGYAVDFCFLIDIIISFRTTYLDPNKGIEVKDPRLIAMRYIRSGLFFLDVVSTVPIDNIIKYFLSSKSVKQLSLLGLIKLTRLIRLRKIIAFLNVNQGFKVGARFTQMIMFLILLLHFVACFWYLLAIYSIQAGDGTWYPPFDLATGTVSNFYGDRASYQYLVTFYYSVLLLIGKANEMAPVDIGQTIYCGFILILGSFVSSFVFSNITTVMEAATQKDSILTQRMNFIQSTMAMIKLPVSLQDEIHKYVMQVEQAPQVQYDLGKFLDSLSPNHKQEVTHYLHHRVISNLEIMEHIHEIEINFIASKLTTLLVLPEEYVVSQGANGNHMYFIINGYVFVYLEQQIVKSEEEEDNFSVNQSMNSPTKKIELNFQGSKQKSTKSPKNLQQFSIDESHDVSIAKDQDALNTLGVSQTKLKYDDDMASRITEERPRKKLKKYLVKEEIKIQKLIQGSFFGELAILSRLKRTASVKAQDYCTLSQLSLESMNLIKMQSPSIYSSFKKQIRNYDDEQMNLRRRMIQNVPFLKKISPQLTNELIILLRENTFDKGSFVIKHGDLSNKVNIIWKGQILVEVFYNSKSHLFEKLNQGGCFCVFSAFSDDYTQIFDFKVTQGPAVIMSIKAQDLLNLAKSNMELQEILDQLDVDIKKHKKTDFDFFRYLPNHPHQQNQEYRRNLRLKFKFNLRKIARNLINHTQRMTETLLIVQQICKERKVREEQLKMLMFKNDQYAQNTTKKSTLQLSHSSFEKTTYSDNSSSAASNLSYKLGRLVKTEEELEQEEQKQFNDKEELKKQKRRNMIKTILNPLDVPGIDLGILQRIDSLPKDQNMYTTSMIESFVNLRGRIEKQQQTKENVQFLNRIIFKQNTEVFQLKRRLRSMIQEFEARMAAVTQQIRKRKDKEQELKKLKKIEKKIQIEKYEEYLQKEEYYKQSYFQSFGQPPVNQGNIQNQVSNYIYVQDDGAFATKLTKIEKGFEPINNTLHQTLNSLSKDQLLHEHSQNEHEANYDMDGIKETDNITSDDQMQMLKKSKKAKKRPKSQMRRLYYNKGQELQSYINEFGGSLNQSKSKKEVRKKRRLSQLADERLEILEPQEHRAQDLSDTLSKVESLVLKQSRRIETPSSKINKTFSRAKQFKDNITNEPSQAEMAPSLFVDEGGMVSLKESAYPSVISYFDKSNKIVEENQVNIITCLDFNKQSQKSQKVLPNSIPLNQQSNTIQKMPQPPRPQTREHSRMKRLDKSKEERKMFLWEQPNQTAKQRKRRVRHASAMAEDEQLVEQTTETKTQDMMNFDFYNKQETQVYNTHMLMAPKPKKGKELLVPQTRFKEKKIKQEINQQQAKNVKLSEQDKQMIEFYRNIIQKSK